MRELTVEDENGQVKLDYDYLKEITNELFANMVKGVFTLDEKMKVVTDVGKSYVVVILATNRVVSTYTYNHEINDFGVTHAPTFLYEKLGSLIY